MAELNLGHNQMLALGVPPAFFDHARAAARVMSDKGEPPNKIKAYIAEWARFEGKTEADIYANKDRLDEKYGISKDAALASDQGGADGMSEARLQLCRRFAASACMAEGMEANLANGKQIDIGEHCLLSSTLVRLASRIGLNRHAREIVPSVAQYLENINADEVA